MSNPAVHSAGMTTRSPPARTVALAPAHAIASGLAVALVLAATLYNFVLCFISTRASLPGLVPAIADAGITLGAAALALLGRSRPLMFWVAVLAGLNAAALGFIGARIDPQVLRAPLAAAAFFALGRELGGKGATALCLRWLSIAVVAVGLFEWLAPDVFGQLFNIFGYYVSKGAAEIHQATYTEGNFFVSSLRPGDRNILPFLGRHRVSSVFLEPVSMGNFGAILAAWALSQDARDWRRAVFPACAAAFVIVAADARFASMVTIAMLAARLVPARFARLGAAILPAAVVVGVLAWAAHWNPVRVGDDLPGRLWGSGTLLHSLDVADLFGASGDPLASLDAGYYYVFRTFGLVMCVAAWLCFTSIRTPTARAARFHLFSAIYICAILTISGTSLFAIKTAALMWFLLGAATRAAAPVPMSPAEACRS